jgi:hypothetical protein
MDFSRFDTFARAVSTLGNRRRILGLPLGLLISGGLTIASDDDAAAGRRRRRKARRSRRQRDQKCKAKSRKSICAGKCGAVKNRRTCGRRIDCGPCPGDLACPECAATEVCRNGECLACTVTCASNQTPEACGAALSAALSDASLATVTVCPGTYAGNFSINRGVTLVGAGQGTDPATNTILSGNQAGRVLLLTEDAARVILEKVRITSGLLANDYGAGIVNLGAGLIMSNCTVSGNEGSNVDGVGIYSQSALQMTACTVSNNACTSGDEALGGGIYAQGPTTLTDCQITGNTTSGEGGGLVIASGATSLVGETTVSGNVAAGGGGLLVASGASLTVAATCQVTHNTATELYGGIANEGTVTLEGSSPAMIVVNNCPDNCLDVPGCTNDQTDCPT